jgi:threonine dehydrogenase-like Zn-dependent dehydrogenase
MARNHPNGTTPTHPPCCERSRMMRTNETEVLQAAAECDFDVAIVGYGPVGQALAALLGQAGHRVGVFERLPQIYGLPRALHIDHEIVRLLQPHAGRTSQRATGPGGADYAFSDYRRRMASRW